MIFTKKAKKQTGYINFSIDKTYKKVAFCGTGTLFFYQVGVLQAILEKYNISEVVGCSGGGIVASLYAMGYKIDDIIDISDNLDLPSFKDYNPFFLLKGFGIISGDKIYSFLKDIVYKKFYQCEIPLNIITTNAETLEEKVYSSQNTPEINIYDAVRASMSIGSVFNIHEINGLQHLDGGYKNNSPFDFWQEPNTIGVYIDNVTPKTKINSFFDVQTKTILASIKENERKHIEDRPKDQILINIKTYKDSLSFNYDKTERINMRMNGYNQAKEQLESV